MKYGFLFLPVLAFFVGCTGNPPEIAVLVPQLNLYQDTELDQTYEKLSVFLRVNDPDGFEDLESLYIIQDNTELFWSIPVDGWLTAGNDTETWIGSNSVIMHDYSSFPRGTYRIIIQDLGGDTTEKSFVLSQATMDLSRKPHPTVTTIENTIRISGQHSQYAIWVYDRNRQQRSTYTIREGEIDANTIISSNRDLSSGFHFFVYTKDTIKDIGLISGPFFYP